METPTSMRIVFETADGTRETLALIPCAIMAKLSLKANRMIQRSIDDHVPTMILREMEIYRDSAEKLIAWMSAYDINAPAGPQELRLSHLATDDFNELVKLYAATKWFHLVKELRGEEVRDEIWTYIKGAALSANEFIMMYELLSFDFPIIKSIKYDFTWARVRGGKFALPKDQDEEIEAYLKEIPGMWEEMMGIQEGQEKHWADVLRTQEKRRAGIMAQQNV